MSSMRIFRTGVAFIALVLLCSSALSAAGKGAAKVQKAAASADGNLLSKLVGKWIVEEEYPPSAPGGEPAKGKGRVEYRMEAGGHVLVGEYKSSCKALGISVEGIVILRYDEEAGLYRYWWHDNFGNDYEFSGRHSSRDNAIVLTREYEDPDTGVTLTDINAYNFIFDGTVVFTMKFGTARNKQELRLTATYTPKGAKKKSQLDQNKPRVKRSTGLQRK